MAQTAAGHLVYIVEDDTDIREIELYTLRSQGMRCEGFGVAKDFFFGPGATGARFGAFRCHASRYEWDGCFIAP